MKEAQRDLTCLLFEKELVIQNILIKYMNYKTIIVLALTNNDANQCIDFNNYS